jgi:hypothetical protein
MSQVEGCHLMKRRLAIIAATILLFSNGSFPSPAAAVVFNATSCSAYFVSNTICFYEDPGAGGDNVLVAQSGTSSDLTGIAVTTGDHGCKGGGFFENSDWNDCISSFWIKLTSGHTYCVYDNVNFSLLDAKFTGPMAATLVGYPTIYGDALSSFRFDC